MKTVVNPMLFVFLLMLSTVSCNNEEIFVEDLVEVIDDTPADPDAPAEDTNSETNNVTTPCDFTLNAVQPGDNVIINCLMDLGGQTITLPSNVTIIYEGGDIINGSLNFSDNSIISGELLNSTVILGGANPQIKDAVFNFDPKRWGIVEGETTSEIALRNNNILEKIMFTVKDLGVSTFKIDKLDAYFEVSKLTSTTTNQNFYAMIECVNIPSDFNLEMTDNTILRVFPTTRVGSATLLGIFEASNVTIKGGVLYGDRDLRQYSGPNVEDGSHLLTIRSGSNVILDGIKFTMGSIGGLNINSQGFSFNPDYDPTKNVTVKNCVFDKIRMISLALTDGRDILIENNEFIDTAQSTQNSDGGVVGYAIDMEPVRDRDSNGELRYYQRVQDITIRGNKERGSRIGAFTIYAGDNIIIENNDFENVVSYSYASNSKIRNNTFTAGDGSNGTAILAAGFGETVFNNEVSGNEISGYSTGVTVYNGKLKIFDNIMTNNFRGVVMDNVDDMEVYSNIINSNLSNSNGFTFQITRANNINIYDNEVNVVGLHIRAVDLNQNFDDQNNNILFDNNQFISSAVTQFSKSTGLTLRNNLFKGRVQISNSNKLEFESNTIISPDGHGIAIGDTSNNIIIRNNDISRPTNFECIYDKDNTQNLGISNNTCD
ncbi:right-handed parallel beta-helix repeat-containing protein [Gaetbulibacter aquiaggeris]|uniref:Right-handed parallel beta-helix repeat-containing protein n=1 Tax=Gaetbulibacter aquiaggeris TaxID=1735373 RepID=A0ABW7MRM9_9FLAO